MSKILQNQYDKSTMMTNVFKKIKTLPVKPDQRLLQLVAWIAQS